MCQSWSRLLRTSVHAPLKPPYFTLSKVNFHTASFPPSAQARESQLALAVTFASGSCSFQSPIHLSISVRGLPDSLHLLFQQFLPRRKSQEQRQDGEELGQDGQTMAIVEDCKSTGYPLSQSILRQRVALTAQSSMNLLCPPSPTYRVGPSCCESTRSFKITLNARSRLRINERTRALSLTPLFLIGVYMLTALLEGSDHSLSLCRLSCCPSLPVSFPLFHESRHSKALISPSLTHCLSNPLSLSGSPPRRLRCLRLPLSNPLFLSLSLTFFLCLS